MRKSSETVRFPQSVQLFKFCFRVLEFRNPNEKIHDQSVGAVLDFNPSDTSHWKRGKKTIRQPQLLDELARRIDVNSEIIHDIAEGLVDIDEAWYEFIDSEEEKRLARTESSVRLERRQKNRELEKAAQSILEMSGVKTLPVHIPSLVASFPFIQLMTGDVSEKLARSLRVKPGQYVIRFRKGELRAHTRMAIAREFARILLISDRVNLKISVGQETLAQSEIFDFAAALLVPRDSLALEAQKISTRANLCMALAEIFCVPRSMIRSRLCAVLLENADVKVFDTPFLGDPIRFGDYNFDDLSFQEEFLDEKDEKIIHHRVSSSRKSSMHDDR